MRDDKFVRERWGTDEQYYKELEEFSKQHHGNADAIEYHNKLGCPIRAIYYFRPYTVVVDDEHLRIAISEVMEKVTDE